MPSRTCSFNNIFMEKRKPRSSIGGESDLVKSAAWAWYQHSSGSNGKPIREFNACRTNLHSKPSRYKLEAIQQRRQQQQTSNIVTSCSSKYGSGTLLDDYEIDWISRRLDYYIDSGRRRRAKYDSGGRLLEEAVAVTEMKNKSVQKKKISSKGVRVRSSHAVVCGTSRDVVVVDKTSIQYSRRRPEKGHVPVVEVVGCRPWHSFRAP